VVLRASSKRNSGRAAGGNLRQRNIGFSGYATKSPDGLVRKFDARYWNLVCDRCHHPCDCPFTSEQGIR